MAIDASIKEIDFFGLDPRFQEHIGKASRAIDDGHPRYAADICRYIIRRQPGCLPVRKILRKAQKDHNSFGSHRIMAMMKSFFSWADYLWGKRMLSKDPLKALNAAEKIFNRQPDSVRANRLLASAAEALGFAQTAHFALEEICAKQPRNVANLLAYGNACLALGHLSQAEKTGDRILQIEPMNEAARKLIKRSSVSQTMRKGISGE